MTRVSMTNRVPLLVCAALAFLILAAGFWSTAQAQSKLLGIAVLTDTTSVIDLSPYVLVQPDPNGRISAQAILESRGQNLTGKMAMGEMINLGHTGESHWLTIRINNNSSKDRWVIDFGRRSQGRLGYIQSAKAYEMTATAETFSLDEVKPVDNKGVFVFTIPKDTQKYVLFNITPAAGRPAVLPIKLYSEEAFIAHTQEKFNAHGVHSYFLLFYAIFFLATAFSRQEYKLFVFSGFFLYELGIWTATENVGAVIGFDMFNLMISGMMLGFTLFSLWMAKIFLDVEYASFTERHVLYGLAWLNILATILSYLLPVSDGLTQICLLYGAPAITLGVICFLSFAQGSNLDVARRYYAMGTVFPVIGIAIVFMELLHLLPHDATLINTLWYSVSVQGFFMVLATQKKLDIQTPLAAVTSANKRVVVTTPSPAMQDGIDFSGMKDAKDKGDQNRLLKVIEKERELLAEFRSKENDRVNEMRRAKEDADEANRAKSAFLAVVSHEIRTPMTGVMGMVRLLLDSSITKQQRDYVLTIQESSEAMMALLNDILDFEKIQHGRIELEDISFDLHRMIQGVITLMSGHAAEKGIALSARVDDDLPKFVKGDPTRLRQVLLNLMGNAIKFTQRGNVTLIVKTIENQNAQAEPDHHLVYFAVQDTGIGIPSEAKKNLFTPFAQANSSIARKFGGTGLGLAISKGLIETMGSAININSKEGEGSTFFFTLKMGQGHLAGSEKPLSVRQTALPAARAVQPLKILVVDDNSITRKVIVSFLGNEIHEIQTAGNAEEALQRINRDAFDLVFMDIELPGLKGNEATRILREHRDPVKSQIPVIAVTGNVAREDMEQYLADGMTGFLPKPIDLEKLQSIVEEIAHNSYEREIRMPESADPFTFTEEDFAKIAAKAEEMPTDKNIFNPDMLQSLKDTIGVAQLEELLNELIVKTDEILVAMDEATKNNDLSTLAARAHELKGMAGNFGLVEISSLAAQAERKAKNADTADLNTLVGSLPDASLRAQSALKDWSSY